MSVKNELVCLYWQSDRTSNLADVTAMFWTLGLLAWRWRGILLAANGGELTPELYARTSVFWARHGRVYFELSEAWPGWLKINCSRESCSSQAVMKLCCKLRFWWRHLVTIHGCDAEHVYESTPTYKHFQLAHQSINVYPVWHLGFLQTLTAGLQHWKHIL